MTNKERYKQAFSVLHTSDQFSVEVENMSRLNKKHNMKVAAAALAGCIFLAGGTGTAYAANVGGIQRTVQVWLHGDQTTANMTVSDDGTYTIEYPDENGETREISGGGIAYEADGTERPLTGEELLEEANSPDVEYNDDGTRCIGHHRTRLGSSLVIQSVLFLYRPKTLSDSDRTSLFFADSHQFFRQFL